MHTGRYNKGCDNTIGYLNCQPCTTRPSDSHYYTTDGDLTDSCAFAACESNCAAGKFRDGCGTNNETSGGFGDSVGECANCTTKETSQYYTGDGGLSDSCPTTDCNTTCLSGQ